MRNSLFALAVGAAVLAGMPALAWQEPARGSTLRADLMDAVRPRVEFFYGAPVQFVVIDLRVSGDSAFLRLAPQRPGGAEIDLFQTPGFQAGYYHPDNMGGAQVEALLARSGRMWGIYDWAMGPTDVWTADPVYCPRFASVLPEFCE